MIKVLSGWFLVRPLFLTYRWLPSCCVIPQASFCVTKRELCCLLSSYKDDRAKGLGPHPMMSLNLNYLLKDTISKYSKIGS